jgi:gluconolactonase
MKEFLSVKTISGVFCALFVAVISVATQPQEKKNIVRLDPALDAIVASDAKVGKLPDSPGPGTREGPTWIRNGGYLVYSDIHAKTINKWNPGDNNVSIFLENTNSDGVTLDRQGRVVWAAKSADGGQIVRLEKDGRRTVLAGEFQGKPLNSPNDLVYKSDGSLYFTDSSEKTPRVYLLKHGEVILLIRDLPHPNGLAFAPGEKYLYVDDSANRTITRFDVQADGTLSNPKLIIDMNLDEAPCTFPCPAGYPDGMKVDQRGNIYSTGPGGIWIISRDGRHLGTILVPDHPANLGFGDADGNTLYVTSRPGLYRVHLKVAGIRP